MIEYYYYYIMKGTRKVSCAFQDEDNVYAELKRLRRVFPRIDYYVSIVEYENEIIFEVDLM